MRKYDLSIEGKTAMALWRAEQGVSEYRQDVERWNRGENRVLMVAAVIALGLVAVCFVKWPGVI